MIMNKVILIGRLTRDPEVKYTTNNTLVCSFSLAVGRNFKKEGQPDADFINIVAWGKTGEFCSKYFNKGQQVAVVGRIQTRNYDDKEGKKVYVTEVIAEEVHPIWDKSKQTADQTPNYNFSTNDTGFNPATPNTNYEFMPVVDDAQLPF